MTAVEICINADDVQLLEANVTAAREGGAARIELCADMQQQGMTPSVSAMNKARHAFAAVPGLLVMIRLHANDMIQQQADLKAMQLAISQAADAGADGVVFGLLGPDRRLDLTHLELLVQQAKQRQLQVTFHRVFDAIYDQSAALNQLIELGVDRVLSAGTLWGSDRGVVQGLSTLQQLVLQAAGRIELVAGGGIHQHNLSAVLQALRPAGHCWSVHSYSAVLQQQRVDPLKVAAMVQLCQQVHA